MGCASGKRGSINDVPILRRRLSLGEVDSDGFNLSTETVSSEDRSTLLQLTQSQIFSFIKDDEMARRKYSIGSETDSNGKLARSFSDKQITLQGADFDPAVERIGFACKKGLKPEAPNQDSFFIMKVEDEVSLYGVFDGHGKAGHDVSNFIKDNLPKILLSQESFRKDPMAALTKTFEKTQNLIEKATILKKLDASRSGSTCSVVMHDHRQNMIYVAHVGDSRVVLGRSSGDDKDEASWVAHDLTIDHKPDLPEERARIEKAGGVVLFDGGWNYRVYAKGKRDHRGKRYPGLNMSRAMGDLSGFYDAGISASPAVQKRHMVSNVAVAPEDPTTNGGTKEARSNGASGDSTEDTRRCSHDTTSSFAPSVSSHGVDPSTDRFLLLCSDGVWEFISSQDAVKTVGSFIPAEAKKAAEHLASMAWDRWMRELEGQVVDDITALVIQLGQ